MNDFDLVGTLYTLFTLKYAPLLKSAPPESALEEAMDAFLSDPIVPSITRLTTVPETAAAKFKDTVRQQYCVTFEEGVLITAHRFEPWTSARWRESPPYYWDSYAKYLREVKHRSHVFVDRLNDKTDRILDHCGNPNDRAQPWLCRGLVVGEVQSGKTGVYTGLINKAADAGYKLIVVLAGTLETLRCQTQQRLEYEFVGRTGAASQMAKGRKGLVKTKTVGVAAMRQPDDSHHIRFPISLTTKTSDFSKNSSETENFDLHSIREPAILVVKKNAKILENLRTWLKDKNTGVKGKITETLFLIDDESDNASVNTKSEDEDPTQINKKIREILELFRNATYIGFTATPYANVLIDSDADDDLFPRDFIQLTEIPSSYFGLNRMLGQETDSWDDSVKSCGTHIRLIEDGDDAIPVVHKQDDTISMNASMKTALMQFLLINAIRDLRGETTAHRTMMINATRFTKLQNNLADQIEAHLAKLRSSISNSSSEKNPYVKALRAVFDEEYSDCGFEWAAVKDILPSSIRSIRVFRVNRSKESKLDPLDYEVNEATGLRAVAVGGLGLSRGLTLEGLCVSYLYRSTVCADTLTQMGRWFGYRDSYLDLCRIWLTEELLERFRKTATSQNELRIDIQTMSQHNMTPEQWGMKIRYTPGAFAITNRNKMRHGEAKRINIKQIFSECLIETSTVLRNGRSANEALAGELWKTLRGAGLPMHLHLGDPAKPWFEGVPKHAVADFVRRFKLDPSNYLLAAFEDDECGIANFIENNSVPELQTWNVAFWGVGTGDGPLWSPDDEVSMHLLRRSVTDIPAWHAGKLVFPQSHLSGKEAEAVGLEADEVRKILGMKDNSVRKALRRARKAPLLVIFPVMPVKYKYRTVKKTKIPADESDGIKAGMPLDTEVHTAFSLSFCSYGETPSDDCFATYIVTKSWLANHCAGDIEDEDDDE